MSRNGSGVYTVPPGTIVSTLTTVTSSVHNSFAADVEADMNTPRPVVAGGTGASSADSALTNLGGTTTGKAVFTAADKPAAQAAIGAELPAGAVMHFLQSTAPSGWLKANGTAVSRVTYASLFAVVGVTYGAGDGSTTFNLPDMRGEFIRSWDDARGIDTARVIGSAQSAAMLDHNHAITVSSDGDHRHRINGNAGGAVAILGNQSARVAGIGSAATESFVDTYGGARIIENAGAHTHTATAGNPSTGGGSETRPRNVALLACIKY